MAIVRWDPFGRDPFEDMFGLLKTIPKPSFNYGSMSVDVFEKDGFLNMVMDLPGLQPEDIDINLENGYLTVLASREDVKEENEKNYYHREIRRGNFSRTFAVGEHITAEDIKAEYNNGVLRLTIPEKEKPEPHKIKVNLQSLPKEVEDVEIKEIGNKEE